MEMLIDDDQVSEVTIEESIKKSEDNGKVIIIGEFVGKRHEGRDDILKEIIANDSLELGPVRAAEIHGIAHSSASKYADGLDISDEDTRARVLSKKHQIADVAVTKLMDALGVLDVNAIQKDADKIRMVSALAGVVEKISGKDVGGNGQVHLHLYGTKQKSVEDYKTIDV